MLLRTMQEVHLTPVLTVLKDMLREKHLNIFTIRYVSCGMKRQGKWHAQESVSENHRRNNVTPHKTEQTLIHRTFPECLVKDVSILLLCCANNAWKILFVADVSGHSDQEMLDPPHVH